jgi:hypothetical protein
MSSVPLAIGSAMMAVALAAYRDYILAFKF